MDLHDLEHNVRDGVHMGSLAGAWLAAVHGLGGMRHHGDWLGFNPRLPRAIRSLTFRIMYLGRHLRVRVDQRRATYTLVRGRPLTFDHYGEPVRLASRSVTRPIPRIKRKPEPKQPPGREPARPTAQPRSLRPPRLRGGAAAGGGGAPTSTPRSRRPPSAAQRPSRRQPSRRSRAPASGPRRRGPSPPSSRAA